MQTVTLTTEKSLKEVINFLRKYGHLDDANRAPDFRAEDVEEWIHPLAYREIWRRSNPAFYQPPISGEVIFRQDYNLISLAEIFESEFEKTPLNKIPDSEEFVLIDIGSHLGRRLTRPFAKKKPHVNVIMIDHLTTEEIERDTNYKAFPRNDIAGEEFYRKVEITNDIEDTVNRLMDNNGYRNVKYIQKLLTYDDFSLDIDEITRTRKVFVTGFRNPRGLGNITTMVGINNNAEAIYLNNSALEKMDPNSRYLELMKGYLIDLGMSENEVGNVVKLMHDPKHSIRTDATEKYNHKHEGERMFSSALRLLFVLSQAQLLEKAGYSIDIKENKMNLGYPNYNQPSHSLTAMK
ncbi:hypothetical protein HOC35_07035 [Candidatus Woesearchaeota archaeon]|jgi:hypothetical protein|nr:hypothetical protein [Candidatus Woesearchaeota archaeon]